MNNYISYDLLFIQSKTTDATYWLANINKSSSTTVINKTTKLLRCPFSGKLL